MTLSYDEYNRSINAVDIVGPHVRLDVPYYEKGQEYEPLPVFLSPEHKEQLDKYGVGVSFWDSAQSHWPNVTGVSGFGYSGTGNAGLPYWLACVTYDASREFFSWFRAVPRDGQYLNGTPANLLYKPIRTRLLAKTPFVSFTMLGRLFEQYGPLAKVQKDVIERAVVKEQIQRAIALELKTADGAREECIACGGLMYYNEEYDAVITLPYNGYCTCGKDS